MWMQFQKASNVCQMEIAIWYWLRVLKNRQSYSWQLYEVYNELSQLIDTTDTESHTADSKWAMTQTCIIRQFQARLPLYS
jgi:hypothetical protein